MFYKPQKEAVLRRNKDEQVAVTDRVEKLLDAEPSNGHHSLLGKHLSEGKGKP